MLVALIIVFSSNPFFLRRYSGTYNGRELSDCLTRLRHGSCEIGGSALQQWSGPIAIGWVLQNIGLAGVYTMLAFRPPSFADLLGRWYRVPAGEAQDLSPRPIETMPNAPHRNGKTVRDPV